VKDPARRRRQARLAWIATSALGLATAYVASDVLRRPERLGGLVVVAAFAAGLGYAAGRLSWGRTEWRIDAGRITKRRRFRSRVRDQFQATSLEVSLRHDSDGDAWYALDALAPGAPASPALGKPTGRSCIVSTIHDATVPRRLGRWLAGRARVPLDDRATESAQAIDLERTLEELSRSGAFGRLAARWLERARRR
jgi:hypothetical protein